MADITIKDLTAGTPLLTDLLIFANPTNGLAKKATYNTLNGVLTLAGVGDVAGVPTNNSILEYDSGEFTFNTNFVRCNSGAANVGYIPSFSAISPFELSNSMLKEGAYGMEIADDQYLNAPSVLFGLSSISKGFLKPRMTTTQRNAIVTPATGLEVFDTTLNLPYFYNGSGWVAVGSGGGSGLTSLNALTASTQTFATSSTGTDFTISSATSTHTFNLPSASAANRGLLTAANWTTFNNKQAALVSGTNIKTINSANLLTSGDLRFVTQINPIFQNTGLDIDFQIEEDDGSLPYFGYFITLKVPSASATSRGALTSTDWTTFNNKQPLLVSGTNIKTVNGTSLLGSGNVVISGGTGLTSLNALTAGTQLFAIASTGTDFTITSSSDTHTFAIPTASASARGLLSSANWTTFNNKLGYTGATADLNLGAYNLITNNVFTGFTSVAASVTLITLTVSSTPYYNVTGSGGQIIKLPDATTLQNGATFTFNNNQSSGAITVNNNSNTLISSIPSGGYVTITLLSNSIAAGSWDRHFEAPANVSWSTNTFDYAGSITSATWNGSAIADSYISSAATWNAKQAALSGTGFVKSTAGTISYDTSTYLTANEAITLSGDVSGNGTTAISTTLATITQASSGNFVKVTLDTKGRVTGNTAVLAADITALGFASALITTNRQTASYTLVLADANKLVELNVATANTLTIPLNSSVAFPIGTQILVSQYGAGACTITATSGVNVRSEGSKLKTNGQYSGATLIKIASDEWYAFGNLIA